MIYTNQQYAVSLDKEDPLSHLRDRFVINDPNLIYLDGNSLGRLPIQTKKILSNLINEQWGNRLIKSWNEGWYGMPSGLGEKFAALIGAKENEVIFCDATSQNLFKLFYGSLHLNPDKTKIVSDVYNFPSDIYLLQGVKKMFHDRHKIVLAGNSTDIEADYEKLFDLIDENTAFVTLSHVVFKSSFMYNMKRVTDYAHSKGALVIWDLSHSAGAMPIHLNDCNADMAVGCSYKYLNGGPGAPAFLYVREDLQEKIESPVWGWFGEENPFEFGLDYRPAKGMRKYLTGTPQMISLAAIEPALNILIEAGMENIRRKSINQTEYLIKLSKELLFPLGFSLGSPLDASRRGSHISLRHSDAFRVSKAMIDENTGDYSVVPDFREPDNIRLGITPLYTSFEEIFRAVKLMEKIIQDNLTSKYDTNRDSVT